MLDKFDLGPKIPLLRGRRHQVVQSPDAAALAWEKEHICSQECCSTELFKQQGREAEMALMSNQLSCWWSQGLAPWPPAPDFSELFSQKQNKNNPPKLEDPYCEVIQPWTREDWIALLASEGYTLTAQSNL